MKKNKFSTALFFACTILISLMLISSVNAYESNPLENQSANVDLKTSEVEVENDILSLESEDTLSEDANLIYISPTGSSTGAGTYESPYDSVQTALNHASGKSEIIFLDGIYSGTSNNKLTIPSSKCNITFRAYEGANPTINLYDYSCGWIFNGGSNYVIDGITFTTKDSSYINAQPIYSTKVTNMSITNCNIIHKGSQNTIYFTGSNLLVENCTLNSLETQSYGSGIYLRDVDSATIRNNTINSFGIDSSFTSGGVYVIYGNNVIIENNTISNPL